MRISRQATSLQRSMERLTTNERSAVIKRTLSLQTKNIKDEIMFSNCETIFEGKVCAALINHMKTLNANKKYPLLLEHGEHGGRM